MLDIQGEAGCLGAARLDCPVTKCIGHLKIDTIFGMIMRDNIFVIFLEPGESLRCSQTISRCHRSRYRWPMLLLSSRYALSGYLVI